MYTQSPQHLKDEKQLACKIKKAPAHVRAEVFAEAYDYIHEKCLAEREISLPGSMFGTDADVVHFLCSQTGKGNRVLEIGCGAGYASIELAKIGNRVTGIDVSSVAIERARHFALGIEGVDFIVSDATAFPMEEGTYDFAFCIDVFEHLHPDDVPAHLQRIYRALRPGGKYLILTVNKYLGPHDVTRPGLGIESLGEHEPQGFHLKEYGFGELKDLLRQAGFRPIRSNILPWRRFPSNVFVPAEMKATIERVIRKVPRRFKRPYKLLFRLTSLASMVCVAHKPCQ